MGCYSVFIQRARISYHSQVLLSPSRGGVNPSPMEWRKKTREDDVLPCTSRG